MKEEGREYRVYGPPGTGKTTYLMGKIGNVSTKGYAQDLLVSSFTRTAAKELVDRAKKQFGEQMPVPEHQIGTLHAHCFHLLERPQIAEDKKHIKEWNKENPELELSGSDSGIDESHLDSTPATNADAYLSEYNINRNRMIDRQMWNPSVLHFAEKWERFKWMNNLRDFTDLIEETITDIPEPPYGCRIGIFDEVQDFTPLQLKLIRSWATKMEYVMLSGDDDQASLPWSKIRTTKHGWVKAEDVDPETHKLTTYRIGNSHLSGTSKGGMPFIKKRTLYSDLVYKIYAGDKCTEVTYNHPCLFRFSESAYTATCVYLMEKDDKYRVGWCQVLRSDGCCHIAVRAHNERADRMWILKVCQDRSEASLWESYVASEFGLSTCMFNSLSNMSNGHYSQEIIDKLFEMLGDQSDRAVDCLEYFEKKIDKPFYTKNGRTKHGSCNYLTSACNLFPEIMEVPIYNEDVGSRDKNAVQWTKIEKVNKNHYTGAVYGFYVERDHTYIADGIITHNCLYLFSGATPEAFNNPPIDSSRKTILDQSYRVPAQVQRLADKIIKNVLSREPKEYKPRQEEGEVQALSHINYKTPEGLGKIIEKEIDQETRSDNRIMIMATCSYMLTKTTKFLKDEGIPFHNPYRITRGDWNPLSNSGRGMSTKDRIKEFLNPQGPVFGGITLWSIGQLQAWIELIQVKEVLNNGYKQKIIEAAKQESMDLDDQLDLYKEAFKPEALEAAVKKDPAWLAHLAVSSKNKKVNELATFLSHDRDILDKKPKIVVGTVHSFKGGQADVVILFPDLSLQAARPYNDKVSSREGYDSVMRQMYVAVTRTFEKLYIAHPVSKKLCFKELFR